MPRYQDGIVNNSNLVISATSDGNFNNVIAQSISTTNFGVSSLVINQGSVFGTNTYSTTINFTYGAGAIGSFNNPAVTILNTGAISDIAAVSVKGASFIGNILQTVGDTSSLYISGPTSISNSTISGNQYSLKVAAGNCFFGGNLTSSGTITCGSIVANSATFTGGLNFSTPIVVTDATESTNTGTGCLVLSGGAGIAKNLNVGGTITSAAISTNTLSLNTLSLSSLTVTGSFSTNGIGMTGGTLKFSCRPPITSGSPYVVNFAAADNYVIIPVNSASAFNITVPSGTNGQMLMILNLGAGILTVQITVDGVASSVQLVTGSKMTLVYYNTWLSIA